ncbi:hypothetical protein GCM10027612_45580 [Microbispora bryophytorum subsp. camponoti]
MSRELQQQPELGGGERDRLAGQARLKALRVDGQVTEDEIAEDEVARPPDAGCGESSGPCPEAGSAAGSRSGANVARRSSERILATSTPVSTGLTT